MVLELQKQQYIAQTGAAQAGQLEASNTTTPQKAIVEGGELGAPVDTLTSTGATADAELKTKRSAEAVKQALDSISIQTGINTNELLTIVEKSMGKSLSDLQNVEQKELNSIVKHFNDTIAALKEDKLEVNFENLEKYTRLYNIQVQNGWDSIDSFRKANKKNNESLIARLYRMKTGKKLNDAQEALELEKFKNLSTEQKAQKLEAYFDSYFNELVKSGKSKEEVDRLQLTDYTKLLYNSSPEEYDMFRDAIEYLVVNNRYKGYDAILNSFDTDAERTKFANETTYEQVEKWNTKADQRGEVASVETAKLNTAAVLEYKDETHLVEYHERAKKDALDFYTEENKAKLAKITDADIKKIQEKLVKIEEIQAIQRKLEQGEKITAEEQALLENPIELTAEEKETLRIYAEDKHHKGDNAGQVIGITNNKVISAESKEELVTTVNADAYEIGEKAGNDFYREVLTQVVNYVRSLPEEAQPEFEAFLKETIGENYTKVANDIANGTKTELSAPSAQIKTETPVTESRENVAEVADKNTVDTRYNANVDINPTKAQTMTAELYANNPAIEPVKEIKEAPQNEAEAVKGGLKAVKEFIKTTRTNIIDTALNILDLNNVGETVKSWAFEKIEMLNDSQLANVCNNMKNNGNKMKAADMIHSYDALKTVDSNNNLVRKHIQERLESLEELNA